MNDASKITATEGGIHPRDPGFRVGTRPPVSAAPDPSEDLGCAEGGDEGVPVGASLPGQNASSGSAGSDEAGSGSGELCGESGEGEGTGGQRRQPPSHLDRNRVVEQYAYLINRVAHKMIARLPPNVELDDLKSAGVIGLIDAAEKYDPEKSTNFRSYAEIRIRGAMVDELRALDWVPRSVRQKSGQIDQTARELAGKLGRPATELEVATELGLSLAEYASYVDKARPSSVVSYEDLGPGQGPDKRDFLESVADPEAENPEQASTQNDRRDLLLRAIHQLGERQRVVLSLYYFEDLNLKEIGHILGVTESRISQIHSKSVRQLKPILEEMMVE